MKYEFNGHPVTPALAVHIGALHENAAKVERLVDSFVLAGKIDIEGQISHYPDYSACHEVRPGQQITQDDLQTLRNLGAEAGLVGQEFAVTPG